MENEVDYLSGLNDAQWQAVTTTEGFVRVIAGAGSGKTRALTHRFAYLVEELGILPGNILCVTFTNKAANEMRRRIHQLTGDNDTGYINTFHGFCVSVLQEDSHAVSYPKSFLVLDNADIDTMLQTIYDERGLSLRDMTFGQARDRIEILKVIERPDYYEDMIAMSLEQLKGKYDQAVEPMDIIFYGYLYQEKKCFGLDYNDLIKFTLYIFEQNQTICAKWQQRLEYIMIDEFQDIDGLQYRLMNALCAYHKNLFIVGDPDQTIYTWRGASSKYLLDFVDHFPGAKTIMMMENYRSTSQILAAANSLIAKNKTRIAKNLLPQLPAGSSVLCHHAADAAKEAEWIAASIEALHQAGAAYRDITILYRAHYVTRNLEEVFLRQELPYTIYSGVQFFSRREIKDSLSYLRMIAFQDDLSFARIVNVPKRNIGEKRRRFLTEIAQQEQCTLYEALKRNIDNALFQRTKAREFVQLIEDFRKAPEGESVSGLLARLLDASGYEVMLRTEGSQERLDNLAELKQAVQEYEISCGEEAALSDYLKHVALFTNSVLGEPGDKVKLMTVHTAKGLEFPYVFLCGLNEGIFPSRKTRTIDGMEEERRLAFVAMTRSEKRLFLSDAAGLTFDGSLRYPSRFILDVEPELIEFQPPFDGRQLQEARAYVSYADQRLQQQSARPDFAVGSRVGHRIFGDGTIIAIDDEKAAYVIQFDEIDTPRSIAFKAKLTRLP